MATLIVKNNVREVMPISLNPVFKSPLKILHHTSQHLLKDGSNFLNYGIPQLIQIVGFVSVLMAFEVPPTDKSHTLTSHGVSHNAILLKPEIFQGNSSSSQLSLIHI